MVATTLVITIVLALVAGIALGYFVVTNILRAFGHRPQKPVPAALTAAEVRSSGD